jgi:hypothetical protein
MTFTWTDGDKAPQTFEGFNNFDPYAGTAPWLGVVTCLGGVDIYWLDDTVNAIEELKRFYRAVYQIDIQVRIFQPLSVL